MTQHEWLDSLDAQRRGRAQELIGRAESLGLADPVALARAEMEEDAPRLVKTVLLRHLWSEAIDPCRDDLDWIDNLVRDAEHLPAGPFADAGQALARILAAGVDRLDVGRLARFIAYEAAFSVVHTLDYGYDPEREDDLPGWALVERDANGLITDREIDGLNEDLLEADPTGKEGRP